LISPQLVTPLLLGMDFCMDNHVVIDFPKKMIIINADNKESATEEDLCPNQMTVEGTTFCNEVYGLFIWNAEDTNNEGKAKKVNNPSEYKNVNSAIAEGKYEHTDANVIRNVEVRSLTLENEGGIGRDDTLQGRSNVGITRSYDVEGLDKGEDPSLSLERLRIEENLSYEEKCKLLELICKYQEHFVTRPGRCNMFEYRFQMQGGLSKSCNSRPIPFSLRREVREQIEHMIKNGTLEISHSPYVNPLTIIQRKDKPVHICVDARQVNNQMVADRAKTPPAHELLKRFHGAKYISSIDLNSAFLQIPSEESSRIWTAFNFEGKTYQFTRVPFGFRSSLASFIRALQLVLGSDSTGYVFNYVDYIIVYSNTYEEHIKHLDAVLGKLTTAGFTINIDKCNFVSKKSIKVYKEPNNMI